MNQKPILEFLFEMATKRISIFQKKFSIIFLTLLLVPCFGMAQNYPLNYRLNKCDYYIVPTIWTFGLLLKYGVAPRELLSKQEIETLTLQPADNFDKFALGKYSNSIDRAGDAMVGVSLFAPLLFSIPAIKENNWQQVATLNIMYAEVLGITFGMAELTKVAVHRVRPYMYNSDLSVDERYRLNSSGDGEKSFYSMHTAFAFSSAVFLSKIYTDSYGKNTKSRIIWAGSLGIATTIGISRVYSGQHFPTDVLVGALVGGLSGYLVPIMHKNKQPHTSFIISPNAFHVCIKI